MQRFFGQFMLAVEEKRDGSVFQMKRRNCFISGNSCSFRFYLSSEKTTVGKSLELSVFLSIQVEFSRVVSKSIDLFG